MKSEKVCSVQLKHGHYRTLNQLQADLELVCSNALSFNQKISKVYKNAQALSKASKKQFQIERSLLLEAIAVLHPGGLEAARKDQAEEEKSLKFAPPPKKPAKPSKPPKKPPTLTGLPQSIFALPKSSPTQFLHLGKFFALVRSIHRWFLYIILEK